MYHFYIWSMGLLEASKHSGRPSKIRIFRAFHFVLYLIISYLENVLINITPNSAIRKSAPSCGTKKVIASLTSFPARIQSVHKAIKSILLQTTRPQKVVLWLADEQFREQELPSQLLKLCKYGLEIKYCNDLRSHKKYYYALQDQAENELVITFDDDIIYHPNTIRRLLEAHNLYPKDIVCSAAHSITLDESGKVNPYNLWGSVSNNNQSTKLISPLTGSGCLYPAKVMPPETFIEDDIRELAFSADDLWIAFMARLSNTQIRTVNKVARTFSVVTSSQSVHLAQVNCIGDGNDQTIRNIIQKYPVILTKLHHEYCAD